MKNESEINESEMDIAIQQSIMATTPKQDNIFVVERLGAYFSSNRWPHITFFFSSSPAGREGGGPLAGSPPFSD